MDSSTLDEIFTILAWSFEAMAQGLFPLKDWAGRELDPSSPAGKLAGQELADGWTAALICIEGDLDYFSKSLGMPHWNNVTNPCSLCLCSSSGPSSYRDFSNSAPWWNTCWLPEQWGSWESKSPCALFKLSHLSACNICYDFLHCKYLGTDQSTSWVLVVAMPCDSG